MRKNIIIILLLIISKNSFCSIVLGAHHAAPYDVGAQCPRVQNVDVAWKTTIEINNDYFQVQRTTDPSWNSATYIGSRVSGCGTCSDHTYHVNDPGPFNSGTTYYYRIQAVSNAPAYTYHDIGSVFFPVPTVIDWKSQVTAEVIVGSTPNDMNQYIWSQQSNIKQGVTINLLPTEISPIYLEQNNSKINFTIYPGLSSLIVNIDVNIDNLGYTNIYNGTPITSFIWDDISSLTSSIGLHSLYVNWLDPASGTNFHREFEIHVVPQSNKLYIDNYCNTMRLWEGSDPSNEIPALLCEGYDSYNTTPAQFYRSAGDALFSCLLQKGFKLYILDFKFNSQDMRNNAAIYASAVQYISSINNKNIIAAGMSMGGVIARYALAKAENDGHPLPVTKFVSIDSPQQGAVISKDLQDFKKDHQQNDAFALHGIDNDAAKELLNYNAMDPSGSMHNTFYNELNNLNGNGYPHLTTNIGVSFSNANPYNPSGTWLKISLDHATYNLDYKTFDLSSEEKVAGSYLPLNSTAIDPVQQYIHWALNLLVVTQPFNNPEVSFARYLNPTFIPHISSLDVINGNSKFDKVIQTGTTSFHDVVPSDIIEPLINAAIIDNLYLQNKTIAGTKNYYAQTITTGYNVTSTLPVGNVTISNGSSVTFKATKKISLKPGFIAYPTFYASVGNIYCDGIDGSQMRMNHNNQNSFNPLTYGSGDTKIIYRSEDSVKALQRIYPNPTNGNFYLISDKEQLLKSNNDRSEIFVYNQFGQLIIQQFLTSTAQQIDLSSKPKGIYFIKVQTPDKVYTEKVVVQ